MTIAIAQGRPHGNGAATSPDKSPTSLQVTRTKFIGISDGVAKGLRDLLRNNPESAKHLRNLGIVVEESALSAKAGVLNKALLATGQTLLTVVGGIWSKASSLTAKALSAGLNSSRKGVEEQLDVVLKVLESREALGEGYGINIAKFRQQLTDINKTASLNNQADRSFATIVKDHRALLKQYSALSVSIGESLLGQDGSKVLGVRVDNIDGRAEVITQVDKLRGAA